MPRIPGTDLSAQEAKFHIDDAIARLQAILEDQASMARPRLLAKLAIAVNATISQYEEALEPPRAQASPNSG